MSGCAWHWQDAAGEDEAPEEEEARCAPADEARRRPSRSFSPMVATAEEMAYMAENGLVKCMYCGNIWDGCSQCLCDHTGSGLSV